MSILDELSQDQPQASPAPTGPPQQDISSGPVAPQASILDELLKSEPAQARPQGASEGVGWDVAKSAAIGVPKGIIGAAGLPGDVVGMMPQAPPGTMEELQRNAPQGGFGFGLEGGPDIHIPTSKDIQSKVEGVTGKFYEPQTSPGKFAQKTTEFLSNPLTYAGAAPLAIKAGTAVAAAIGSEAARQAAEGLGPIETAAEVLGGLVGGHLPNSVNKAITRSALRNAATVDDLFNASGNLYEKAYNSGVQIKPSAGADWAYDIISDLRKDGFRPYTPATEAAFRTIGELGQTVNQQGQLGIPEIDTIRKALNKISGPDRVANAIARYGISKIDENMSNLTKNPDWLATGHQNAGQVASDMTQARATYAAAMRSSMLEDAFNSALERADLRTGTTGKGGNLENTMRQEIKSIVQSNTKRRGFSDDELSALTDIAKGSGKTNLLRGIGALAPTGIVSGTLGLELGHLLFGGTKAMLGLPVVGYAAKKMGEAQTRKAIEDVAARTRMRGFAGPQPEDYVPATGYRAPLFSSTLGTNQSRGGAIAMKLAKKMGKRK